MKIKEEILQKIAENKEHRHDEVHRSSDLYAEVWNTSLTTQETIYFRKIPVSSELMDVDDAMAHFKGPAFSQLLSRSEIRKDFYNKCSPDLQQHIFQEFVTEKDRKLLLRFEDDDIRAVLSEKYGVIDDHEVFPVVFDVLQDQEIQILGFYQDDFISRLSIIFNDAVADYNSTQHAAGLMVTNSETGNSSVWIEPVVTIPSCSFVNRHALRKQDVDCRIVHRGEVNEERIRNMVSQAKEIAQVGIIQVCEAWTKRITSEHALNFAKGIDSLPKRMFDILKEEWEEEEEILKAEVARRIIMLAQELPLFQRIQAEQATGKILGLFDNYKKRMEDILTEME